MPQLDNQADGSHIYTMRELNHETPRVIREINENGRPAVITRRGRFVALISPLADRGVESAALSAALDEAPDRAQLLGEENVGSLVDIDEAAHDVDVPLPRQ